MLFNSLSFLIFFPVTTIIYFALPQRFRWVHLLACSCLFYASFIPRYLIVLLGVILIDFGAGLGIERSRGPMRRVFLVASLLANVGILAAFKYFNFFNGNVRALAETLHWNYPVRDLGWLLPIGLSFHTFQSMSYTIEVYLGRQKAERHLGIYALYVMFYPQLVAGPIERPQSLLHQFREHHAFDADRIFSGLRLMLWGFFKKLVVADRLAPVVDAVYGNPHAYGGGWLLAATYFFAIQIYCDFSGYSDVAIGAARVLGFGLMKNFDRPYAAASVPEFWRRWHISLSTWFRDYLYIPLGGSRVPVLRWCFNIMVVFVVSGMWHGSNWTYLAWGALHGILVIGSRLTRRARARIASIIRVAPHPLFSRVASVFVTFNLVALTWIFFRASSIGEAGWILSHLGSGPWLAHPDSMDFPMGIVPYRPSQIRLALLLVLAMWLTEWAGAIRGAAEKWARQPAWVRWPAYYALIVCLLLVGDLGTRTFIYFQF
jgi:D-alanyl-lipoteichoic acid acyltransferase DltB (MBOAT superfamily)